jgi:prevent-host-death family protein
VAEVTIKQKERMGRSDMTTSSYNLVMVEVRIAELKAKLSEYLRAVRRGHSITVLDRDQPIARIVPYRAGEAGVRIRKPLPGAGRLQDVPLPPPLPFETDIVALLLEDREKGR